MLYTARRPSTDIFSGGGGGCISILAYANSANGGKCKIKVQDLFIRLSAVLVSAELIYSWDKLAHLKANKYFWSELKYLTCIKISFIFSLKARRGLQRQKLCQQNSAQC